MKLLMFGCSLTKICGIPNYLQKLVPSVIDFSESASSNRLQIQRYNDYIKDNVIESTDIILWQITSLSRPWARLSKKQFLSNQSLYVPINLSSNHYCYVENHEVIDLLCNALYNHVEPEFVTVNQLLSFLNEINQKHNLIVWIGHEGFLENYNQVVLDFLVNHNIKHCKQYFTRWCLENKLPFMDDLHPLPESGASYAEQCIVPVLSRVGEGVSRGSHTP